ncbi:MAG: cytochrome c, partial [Bacteroidota bacterium]
MKTIYFIALCLGAVLILSSLGKKDQPRYYQADESVANVLERLGDTPLPHKPNMNVAGVSAERGYDLMVRGIAGKPGGGKTRKQSKHFICTSCHNIKREDPDLSVSDPQARLEYAAKNDDVHFLQGTAMYGAVNRTSFYNDDYFKKYGQLVEKARNNLREAIQLCAVECAQGRRLKSWELESILAYLWTIDLKMSDLIINANDMKLIENALTGNGDTAAAIDLIKAKYLQASPATFVKPPDDRKAGYTEKGNAANGELIYEQSCLYCHEEGRPSFFRLDDSKMSLNFLDKHFPK